MPEPTPDHGTLTDALLAVRCQLGEPGALDALVDRWHEPLWRYLRGLLAGDDEAAETLQDTWLRVLRGLPALREPGRLRPWLFGIARRAAMDRLRRRYARPPADPDALDDLAAPEPEPARADELAVLGEELVDLPLVEREVLVLFYLRELSLADTAAVLAISVGTVKSRLHRARGLLRRRLSERGIQP